MTGSRDDLRWHPEAAKHVGRIEGCPFCFPYEEQKRSARDHALMRTFSDRAARVRGWLHWPHSREEVAGIRSFLETGDESRLPAVYSKQEG